MNWLKIALVTMTSGAKSAWLMCLLGFLYSVVRVPVGVMYLCVGLPLGFILFSILTFCHAPKQTGQFFNEVAVGACFGAICGTLIGFLGAASLALTMVWISRTQGGVTAPTLSPFVSSFLEVSGFVGGQILGAVSAARVFREDLELTSDTLRGTY